MRLVAGQGVRFLMLFYFNEQVLCVFETQLLKEVFLVSSFLLDREGVSSGDTTQQPSHPHTEQTSPIDGATKTRLDAFLYRPSDLHSSPSPSPSACLSYSLLLIKPSISFTSSTWILANHPSASGPLLIVPGFSSNSPFVSVIVPEMGVMMSEADLTDSTAPMVSPLVTLRSLVGSST